MLNIILALFLNYLKCAHLNIRSASTINKTFNKSAIIIICELVSDYNLDILLPLSESWFTENTLPALLNSLIPDEFFLLHTPRSKKSVGGFAVIYRSQLKANILNNNFYNSFEVIASKFSIYNSNIIIYTRYFLPSTSNTHFLTEFSPLLEDVISLLSETIIFGDFIIHVDTITLPECVHILFHS